MKIEFAPSFFKSLKRISLRNRWYWKLWELFRYDLPWFFNNIVRFRKELWRYRTWDSAYSLLLFKRGLEFNKDSMQKYGQEVDSVRLKRIAMITRAIELLDNYCSDKYIEQAEKEIGTEVNHDFLFKQNEEPEEIKLCNEKIFDKTREIEETQWNELWEIIKGREPVSTENVDPYEAQDGSGIKGWWN